MVNRLVGRLSKCFHQQPAIVAVDDDNDDDGDSSSSSSRSTDHKQLASEIRLGFAEGMCALLARPREPSPRNSSTASSTEYDPRDSQRTQACSQKFIRRQPPAASSDCKRELHKAEIQAAAVTHRRSPNTRRVFVPSDHVVCVAIRNQRHDEFRFRMVAPDFPAGTSRTKTKTKKREKQETKGK